MMLTRTRSVSDDKFPTSQLGILAICRLAEPIAISSIFPYAWLMVQSFHIGNENDASFYAGILISAFSLCEAISGMFWGSVSDRVGRKPVVLIGCCGTMISLLMVGFAKSFWFALLGRLLGGLLNGNIGVIQTMVGELISNPSHEVKANAVMPFIFNVGTIVGPAIGGILANPVRGFPSLFPKGGFFDEYPWALPNIVCATIMLFSIVLSYFCLMETHPDLCNGADSAVSHDIAETAPMISVDSSVDLLHDNYGTFNEVEVSTHDEWIVRPTNSFSRSSFSEKHANKWLTWRVAMLVAALGIYSYHSMCFDHLFPIFLQDRRAEEINILMTEPMFHIEGGLGLSTKTVGMIMSVNGVIALVIQAIIFPIVANGLGVFRTFMMVTILHPIVFFIVPCLVLLPANTLFLGIYVCLTIRQFLSILDYPVLLIMLKQASPTPRYLGKINGLAASIGATSRMIAPPIAGLLYAEGSKIKFTGLAWYGAGIVAIIGVFQLFMVPRERKDLAAVKAIIPGLTDDREHSVPQQIVDIRVVDLGADVEHQN